MLRTIAGVTLTLLLLTACSFELPGRADRTPEPTPRPHLPRATPTAPPGEEHAHIVQPGETLAQIASRYETTVQALARANNIENPERIFVGQVIVVPNGRGMLVICDTASLARTAQHTVANLEKDLRAETAHFPSYLSLVDYLSLRALEELDAREVEREQLDRALAQLAIYLSRLNSGHITWSEEDLANFRETLDGLSSQLPEPTC